MGYATKSCIAEDFRATGKSGGLKGLLMPARGGGRGGGHAVEGGGANIT